MYPVLKSNLGRRVLLLVSMSMVLILAALVISGVLAAQDSYQRILGERSSLAEVSQRYLDYVLRQDLERLDNFRFAPGVNVEDNDLEPEKSALHATYLGSIFDAGVFLTDKSGKVSWVEPLRLGVIGTSLADYTPVQQSLTGGKPLISNVVTISPGGEKVLMAISPVRNPEGRIVGLVVGQVSTSGRVLREIPQSVGLGPRSYMDIVDSNGVILTSSDPHRILLTEAEIARNKPEVSVSVPLSMAPWSVAVRQAEDEAMAPVRTMQWRFILFGSVAFLVAIFLSWGTARSFVKPLGELTTAAERIADGDLSQPITQQSSDEIGQLGRSLDRMRIKLKKSLEDTQKWNRELEAKVAERTRQLEDSYHEIERKESARGELLRKVLSAQEEERKRIARELHDETSQSLASLVMRLDSVISRARDASPAAKSMLSDVKSLAVRTIDNVHKIIYDLRPAVLDDLGLLAAIRWYAESRLGVLGIKLRIEVAGEDRNLPQQFETAVFRVVQEAITNIVRHSEAHDVMLSIEYRDASLAIEVEDDGKGFDPKAMSLQSDEARGLGLLGMEERVSLLGGKFQVESQPGRGTHLTVEVPLPRRQAVA